MSARVTATELSGFQDSARIYKWDVEINFGGLPSSVINLRCVSTAQPQPDFNVIESEIRGFSKVESGAVTWNAIELTPVEVQDYSILMAVYDLGRRQFDYESGAQENKSSYTGDTRIMLENLQDAPQFTWVLHGCLIESYSPPEMTGAKGEVVNMPFTVRYDYATRG